VARQSAVAYGQLMDRFQGALGRKWIVAHGQEFEHGRETIDAFEDDFQRKLAEVFTTVRQVAPETLIINSNCTGLIKYKQ
jgi:hypothetical protein